MSGGTDTEVSPREYSFPVPKGSTGVGASERSVYTRDPLSGAEVLEE